MRLTLLLPLMSLGACAWMGDNINVTRAYNYLSVPHVVEGGGDTGIEGSTPGIAAGSEAPTSVNGVAVGLEAGVWRDPDKDTSLFANGYAEYDLIPSMPRRLRAGLFVGLNQWGGVGEEVFGDVYLTGGLQVTAATFGRHELRFRVMEGFGGEDLTFFLGSNIKF